MRAVRPGWVERLMLPADEDSRHLLALRVDEVLRGLGGPGTLLRQMAWGDGWTEASLRAALAHRELARRDGRRVRVNYRFTFRQLAVLHDCDAKTIWRRVQGALGAFGTALAEAGLLWQPEANDPVMVKPLVKQLKAREFKKAG
jgi:hypothetical protein